MWVFGRRGKNSKTFSKKIQNRKKTNYSHLLYGRQLRKKLLDWWRLLLSGKLISFLSPASFPRDYLEWTGGVVLSSVRARDHIKSNDVTRVLSRWVAVDRTPQMYGIVFLVFCIWLKMSVVIKVNAWIDDDYWFGRMGKENISPSKKIKCGPYTQTKNIRCGWFEDDGVAKNGFGV